MKKLRNPPRCCVCGRRLGSSGDLVALRPNGTRIALCGRQPCTDKYNDDPLPAPRLHEDDAQEPGSVEVR